MRRAALFAMLAVSSAIVPGMLCAQSPCHHGDLSLECE